MPLYCLSGDDWIIWRPVSLGNQETFTITDIEAVYYLFPKLLEASSSFAETITIEIDNDVANKVLYVYEGEIAFDINLTYFHCVGSDDATTCHILLAKNRRNNNVLCAHINTPEKCFNLNQLLDQMVLLDNNNKSEDDNSDDAIIDIFLSGGIRNDDQSSDITVEIINELNNTTKAKCYLNILNTFGINSEIKSDNILLAYPKVLGCGFIYDSNNNYYKVCPMTFHKDKKGPNRLLRRSLTYSDVYTNNDQLFIIYGDNNNKMLRIPYFKCLLPISNINYYLSLDDNDFLQEMSTSPHCEPLHFCSDSKEVLEFCKDPNNIKNQFIKDNNSNDLKPFLYYQMGPNGWEEQVQSTTVFNINNNNNINL